MSNYASELLEAGDSAVSDNSHVCVVSVSSETVASCVVSVSSDR